MKKLYLISKRIMDIICSVCGIIVTSPVFLIAVLGIIISDFGPVFYFADRVGINGNKFKMYKFRSMKIDKNASEKCFKADENRIFPWGKFMRKTKIDELPQLLNVLKGDMSVVGPRPASIDQVDVVRGGKYALVSTVKPGLTNPGAIYDYIYGDSVENEDLYRIKVLPTRLELELAYVSKNSFVYDIKMIFYTIICIISTLFGVVPKKILNTLLNDVNPNSDELMNSR